MTRLFTTLLLLLTLAACDTTGGLSSGQDTGINTRKSAVDGLIVGHRLMAAKEYELALKAYYRAAGEKGITVDVLSAIGSANMQLGRLGQAETALRRAIALDETFVPAWNNLGIVLVNTGQIPEAVETFKRAFALDSGRTTQIRDNLSLALAMESKIDYPGDEEELNNKFSLVRRGNGEYLLLSESDP